ncbi:MAG: plastocyanin/azurin family copper-binding protein [archaeon]|nr:cupredoxin domain-containing protein [Nanoarchaeota archaeon]
MILNKLKISAILLSISTLTLFLLACSGQVPEDDTTKTVPTSTVVAGDESDSGIKTVTIQDFKFNPVDLDVEVGDTVEWVNLDDTEHTITLENGDLDQEIGVDGTLTYTFEESGIYRYFCMFHPGMQGSVNVN